MTVTNKLVDQHFRENEARLLHLDEMLKKAEKVTAGLDRGHHLKTEFAGYREQHDELSREAADFREISLDQWRDEMIQAAGPMGVLDILAQKIESLIEELEN